MAVIGPQREQSRVTLLGRESELGELQACLDRVPSGTVSTVVCGDAGMGKSSLLRWTAESAQRRGFTVLPATGVEFERNLAFSGLSAVLRPLLGHAGSLAETHRAALDAATGVTTAEAPALRTYTATLALLSSAASETPVAVVVDDAQWIDQASLESLVFAAHRLAADPVGFVFAQRSGVSCLLDHARFERIELTGLSRDVAVRLLAAHDVTPHVAARCWELTEGNPLALIEGATGLTARQRSGNDPLPPALPAASRLVATFRGRLDGLPDATGLALAVAALTATDELTIVSAALSTMGGSVADLEPAERCGLIRLARGRVTWRHPLQRTAVYQQIDDHRRRAVHGALGAAEQEAGHEEQALWHLTETALGADAEIARRMAALGVAARRRGALTAAAEAHERAAQLCTNPRERDRQFLAAGDARWAAGELLGTVELLNRRIDAVEAVDTQAEMAMLLGQAEMWTAGSVAGVDRFEQHATAVAELRPDIAAFLLLHAVSSCMLALDGASAVRTAERAVRLAERSGDAKTLFGASTMYTLARFFAGADASAAGQLAPISQLALAALDIGAEGADDLAQLCGYGLVACERWHEATDVLQRIIRKGEMSGMVARSAFARVLLAEVWWRTGRWPESMAELSQSLSLQEAIRPDQVVPGTLAVMARLEAGLGQTERCRAHAAQVLDAPPRIEMFMVIALSAIGLLELGAGRYSAAAAAFDQIVTRAQRVSEPGWLWWQADAIEAYAGCRRTSDAGHALARLEAHAAMTERGWALAGAARGRGFLASGVTADEELTAALEAFRKVGSPFEEGRTLLVRGQRRIRQGAPEAGARDVAAARTIFDRLGARPWSERASALRGEANSADSSLTGRLTSAELRVAMAVGHGASNRDAADQLFISPKTVDYHLQSIYRKLGLRSRNQLMALVLTDSQ